ncbi:MAG: fructose-bisphosphate aldolase [Ignavibacteriae bacterium]|nr:fructose-bisphosphate aldolase [Ignavibacteriota bacterium]
MQSGKQIRLHRIWKHERAVIIPFDHAAYSGPSEGIEDLRRLTERIATTEADAILVNPGALELIAPVLGGLGVILRLDGGFTKFAAAPTDYRTMCPVENALTLGADAGIVFTFVGTPHETESLERLGRTAADAGRLGLPLIAEILPPSLLNNHFGSSMFPTPKADNVFEETLAVARIGAEAGADVIKTRYTGNVEQFREIVRQCGVRVLVAGGPNLNGTDEQLLQLAFDCVQSGAAGIIFGRNVWQHPKMEQLIAAFCAIVHDEESVQNALKLLR